MTADFCGPAEDPETEMGLFKGDIRKLRVCACGHMYCRHLSMMFLLREASIAPRLYT